MALRYQNLDEETRAFMLREYDMDSAAGCLYICKRLTDVGRRRFPALLRIALRFYDDAWLAEELRRDSLVSMVGAEPSRAESEAPDMLAECEFNRYYMRGLCARAVAEGISDVEFYRARVVVSSRREFLQHIGECQKAHVLLADLHDAHDKNPASVSLYGNNTGLTIRLT